MRRDKGSQTARFRGPTQAPDGKAGTQCGKETQPGVGEGPGTERCPAQDITTSPRPLPIANQKRGGAAAPSSASEFRCREKASPFAPLRASHPSLGSTLTAGLVLPTPRRQVPTVRGQEVP